MNDAGRPDRGRNGAADGKAETGGESSQGPNLVLLYSLIALALAVAIGLAALIVLPFYQHR
ncbi:MAG: hypothetical protein ABR860_10870 [Terracidiphilus sp.]|jgi:hypothetical protein